MADQPSRPFVIVGGGVAAAEAAKALRAEGYDRPLVIITDEPLFPYERPPLTKEYLRGEVGADALLTQPALFYEEAGIDVRTGTRAVALDVASRSLDLDNGARLGFDSLLLATGARATRPALGGIDEPWVHLIRTAGDADRLRAAAGGAASAVVAGGGWIAAEAAASLRQMGLEVTLVVPGAEVLERHLGPEVGREFSTLHERNGVRVVRSSRVTGLGQSGGRREVRLDSGEVIPGDLAVVGLGAAPAVELAQQAGLDVADGILVDDHLRTSADGIYAVGDVASAWIPRYGERVRSEHWDNARRQGRTAARNMLGLDEPFDRVPYFYSDQFDLSMELFGRPGTGTAQLVRREDHGVVVLWTRDDVVVAGMHANLRVARKPIDRLVSTGGSVDAGVFLDPGVPLEEALAARV
jgi:3-phenylpropionate/trans-cinnamate dioxygenase ferredoxin reductase subunit